MGTLILIITIVIELAVVTASFVTKSPQEKTRSIIRIGALVIFVMLTLVSVIQWSFRWVGLAALLFFWAASGWWRLRNSRSPEGVFKARDIIFRAITALLLVFISVTPVLMFPQYEPLVQTGPYKVATARYTYTDTHRIEEFTGNLDNRRVNVSFWYPQNAHDDETYPLILFSHGGLSTETSNESLYLELASHGYVVGSIGHPYHAFWTTGEDRRVTFVSMEYFQEIQREDAKRDKRQSYGYYQKWMDTRTRDINFVMDSILNNAGDEAGGFYGLIDIERIGVMGHSLGGSAALAIPRQRDDVDAVIALESPFLYDIVGVENDEFIFTREVYPVPVLNIYSDSAWGHLGEWAQYARNASMLLAPSATEFSVHHPGAGHFSLTDLSLTSPMLVRMLEGEAPTEESAEYLRKVNQACLEFFDRYLKTGLDDHLIKK